MKNRLKRIIPSLLAVLMVTIIFSTNTTKATTIELSIGTSKTTYTLGEKIDFFANLTIDGTQISDALIALQVKDSRNNTILVRALNATTPAPNPLPILLKETYPCDAQGNLKISFKRGSAFGVKAVINNTQGAPKFVVLFVTLQFSDGTTMNSIKVINETVPGNYETSFYMYPIAAIPDNAPLGNAYFYGVALSELPENQGYAWCPEKVTIITITSGSFSMSTTTAEMQGNYNTSISTSTLGGLLGNYTVYASTFYNIWRIMNQTTFEVVLLGDITGPYGVPDGKVDGIDMWRVAKDFGWVGPPGGKISDVNKDGRVDGIDMWIVAKDFGKVGQYP